MNLLYILLLFIIPLLTVMIPIYLGQRYGFLMHAKYGKEHEVPVGSVVAATFGLLAFMLAFTFQMAENRYTARKSLLLEEVTLIRSAYLRSGILPDSVGIPSKKLLKEYVELRIMAYNSPEKIQSALTRSQEILDELWSYSETMNQFDRSSEAYSLYATSINELTNVYHQRVVITLNYRIPATILFILGIIAFFSMLVLGYQFGNNGHSNFTFNFFMAITFASVMWLILILDRPELGIARLDQQPVIDLQSELNRK